jgi:hypothetical protein
MEEFHVDGRKVNFGIVGSETIQIVEEVWRNRKHQRGG